MFSRFELEGFGKTAADAYLTSGSSLNDTITKLAREQDLNGHQVERVAQAANTVVNAGLVKKARDERTDPRVRFDLADASEVQKRLRVGDEPSQTKVAFDTSLNSAFKMEKRAADQSQVLDAVFGARMPEIGGDIRDVDHGELAEAYVKTAHVAESVADRVTSASLGSAVQTLETLEAQARAQATVDKLAMDDIEQALRDELADLISGGTSPATIRATVKRAGVGAPVGQYVDGLVTKVAAALGAREGVNAFADRAVANAGHPLFDKAAAAVDACRRAGASAAGHRKIAGAMQSARSHFTRAAAQGR